MNPTIAWKRVKNILPNLHVLTYNGTEIGFITKPKDSRTDKNAWRLNSGLGDHTLFLGHDYDKKSAMVTVEKACGVYQPKA
jgi:hypothetical protein